MLRVTQWLRRGIPWLFLPGLALTVLIAYRLAGVLWCVVAWQHTDGVVSGSVDRGGSDEVTLHEKAEFRDRLGRRYEAIALSGVGAENLLRQGTVRVVYDPDDPRRAYVIGWRDALIFLLLPPFALVPLWLGWPHPPSPRRAPG